MNFLRNWPFQHYLTLRLMNQSGLGTYYYHISEDRLLSDEQSVAYSEKPNRRVEKYLIVGPARLINQIFTDIPKGIIPTIPEEINRLISEHQNQDDFIATLLRRERERLSQAPSLPPQPIVQSQPIVQPQPITTPPQQNQPNQQGEQTQGTSPTQRKGPTTPRVREEEFKPPFTTKIPELVKKVKQAVDLDKCVKLDTGSVVKKGQSTYIYNQNNEIPLCVAKNTDDASRILRYYEDRITEAMGGRRSSEQRDRRPSEQRKLEKVNELQNQQVQAPLPSSRQNPVSPVRYRQATTTTGQTFFGVPTQFQRRQIPNVPLESAPINTSQLRQRLPTGKPTTSDTQDVLSIVRGEQRVPTRQLDIQNPTNTTPIDRRSRPTDVNVRRRPEEIDVEYERQVSDLTNQMALLSQDDESPALFSRLRSRQPTEDVSDSGSQGFANTPIDETQEFADDDLDDDEGDYDYGEQ